MAEQQTILLSFKLVSSANKINIYQPIYKWAFFFFLHIIIIRRRQNSKEFVTVGWFYRHCLHIRKKYCQLCQFKNNEGKNAKNTYFLWFFWLMFRARFKILGLGDFGSYWVLPMKICQEEIRFSEINTLLRRSDIFLFQDKVWKQNVHCSVSPRISRIIPISFSKRSRIVPASVSYTAYFGKTAWVKPADEFKVVQFKRRPDSCIAFFTWNIYMINIAPVSLLCRSQNSRIVPYFSYCLLRLGTTRFGKWMNLNAPSSSSCLRVAVASSARGFA